MTSLNFCSRIIFAFKSFFFHLHLFENDDLICIKRYDNNFNAKINQAISKWQFPNRKSKHGNSWMKNIFIRGLNGEPSIF